MQPHERIFVALDTDSITRAKDTVEMLKGKVGGFKLGLEFFTSVLVKLATYTGTHGPEMLFDLKMLFKLIGKDLFWDGKFDDIPNTVGKASAGLVPISPKFFNVHASAGRDAVRSAAQNKGESGLLAVTLLTSFDKAMCKDYFFGAEPDEVVVRWSRLAVEAGTDGLVCSPADLEFINRNEKVAEIPKMTPGIRPAWSVKGDQSRIMTPAQALKAGSTWMVIGRPITECSDGPVTAVERITEEIASV